MKFLRAGVGFAAVAAAIALSGCVNLEPPRDRVRDAALGPGGSLAGADGAAGGVPLFVGRPDLPEYVRSKHLVYRREDGTLARLGGVRWAEPMEEGVARAVAEFLMRRGGVAVAGYYPWPRAGSGDLVLTTRFFRLGADAEAVRLRADWTVRKNGAIVAEGRYSAEPVPWEGGASRYIDGWNAVLDALAGEVAAALRERSPGIGETETH